MRKTVAENCDSFLRDNKTFFSHAGVQENGETFSTDPLNDRICIFNLSQESSSLY